MRLCVWCYTSLTNCFVSKYYENWEISHIKGIIISVLPKGRSSTANSGTCAAVLLKGRTSTANSGTQAAVLLGMDRCGNFPLLFAPHSLFSIWTDLKRSENIPGAPTWRWGQWIWLTGQSGLHRNSPQGSNISSILPPGFLTWSEINQPSPR